MIAPRQIPKRYVEWNLKHGAPVGRRIRGLRFLQKILGAERLERLRGPFAIQGNSTTREFEYPWAFEAGRLSPGMKVMEVGGSLCGFQFVLDRFGCQVANIDPGEAAKGVGWPCNQESIQKLNQWFGCNVKLYNSTIEEAGLEEKSFDRVFAISVVEHLTEEDKVQIMKHAHRCLKPGGIFVLTVDLFLNLEPFCTRQTNEYGRNQDIRRLMASEPWELETGNPAELHGFEAFNPDAILSRLEQYYVGFYYPTLTQCVVLRKPAG
jgi:SAM-dependent methyltransferase